MKLVAMPKQLARSTKIEIQKVRNDNTIIAFFVGRFDDHKEFVSCSKRLGVAETLITSLLAAYKLSAPAPAEIQLTGKTQPQSNYRVRMELGSKDKASLYPTFDDALQSAIRKGNSVIEWQGVEHTCCLDVDFPEHYKPTNEQLIAFCDNIKPQPVYYWLSKSRGLHLIYVAKDFYNADELAAVGGYHLSRYYPNANLEFLHRTRAPMGKVYESRGSTDIDILRSLLLEYREDDSNEYLTNHGYIPGTRYPHTKCPVNPSERAKGNTDPVVIYNDHIFCYICQKDGKTCGSRRAGYFPIAALSGSRINTQIATCVNNFVHYSHAKHILNNHVPNQALNRKLYSSLLKLKHGDDTRIPMVFEAAEPNGLIRYDGYWCDYNGAIVEVSSSSPILRQLPHCHDLQPNGATVINPASLEWLSLTVDQSPRGYYAVTPIRGVHITQYQELPDTKIYNVLNSPNLAPESMKKKRPQYLPQQTRLPIGQAWGIMEKIFPGIDRKLIEILIVGRGCMEHHSGLPPMLFLTGPTGSGKTSHVEIAAAICGDVATTVSLKQDRDRFFNSILKAKQAGGFVFFDEFFKYAKAARLDDVEAMENLLAFTADSLVYLVHVGSVPLGELPFFLWADTGIPHSVQQHEQLGRRVFHYKLHSAIKWDDTMRAAGVLVAKNLRVHGTPEIIAACNAILSDVIENHFTTPATDFSQVANKLGIKHMRDGAAMEDKNTLIQEFFTALCNAPAIEDANDKRRFSSPGFKIARIDGTTPLYTAFDLCQNDTEKRSTSCKALEECDLQNVLGLTQPATLDIRKHGLKFAIRIVGIDGVTVNEKLRN